MTDDSPLGEEIEFSATLTDQHGVYVVLKKGDGYYYGEPVAVFFDETVAHTFARSGDTGGCLVAKAPFYETDQDGLEIESTYNLERYRMQGVVLDAADVSIVDLLDEYGVTPDDPVIARDDEMRERIVSELLSVETEEIPAPWTDLVEERRDEMFDE